MALADKMKRRDSVTIAYFGDGAASRKDAGAVAYGTAVEGEDPAAGPDEPTPRQ